MSRQAEAARLANTTHGQSDTALYHAWEAMKQRCTNPKHPEYSLYGGQGISFQAGWQDFETFAEWAMLSGYNETLELDRINNTEGYTEANCRWTTRSWQCFNKRSGRNTSGRLGVSYDSKKRKYLAQLVKDGQKVLFKRFNTYHEACEAISAAEQAHYGQVRDNYLPNDYKPI